MLQPAITVRICSGRDTGVVLPGLCLSSSIARSFATIDLALVSAIKDTISCTEYGVHDGVLTDTLYEPECQAIFPITENGPVMQWKSVRHSYTEYGVHYNQHADYGQPAFSNPLSLPW